MKKILFRLSIILGGFFVLWLFLIYPYSHCTTKQIEVMKQELIDGIIEREIKLRELYAKANGKEFIQTEELKQKFQKEKEKFYMYCNNDGESEYKNEYCEVTRSMSLLFFERYSSYDLKYHFDKESQVFFNQIVTYWGHKKKKFHSTQFGTHWEDRFWRGSEDESLQWLYPVKILGYSSDYSFYSCANSKENWLLGMKELELARGEAVMKKDLLFIESKHIQYKSISFDKNGRQNYASFGKVKTYIKREKDEL